jgi:hypothetical protein
VTTVHLFVHESLWNNSGTNPSDVVLEGFPTAAFYAFQALASADARGINPRIGDQLLVVAHPKKNTDNGQISITNYEIVLTDASLFPLLRQALVRHSHYVTDPGELGALEGLNKSGDMVLCGYLVRYLWEARPIRAEPQAPVFSKLLLNRRIPDDGLFYISMALNRLLLNTNYQPSDSTRHLVINDVIEASAAELTLAKRAMPILLRVSDGGLIDLKPFLNARYRNALASNYRTLVASGQIAGKHTEFESELRP